MDVTQQQLSPAARASSFLLLGPLRAQERTRTAKLAPQGRAPWMARVKETNQRKGPSRTELTPEASAAGIFRLGIHASVGKRRTSCAPPFGPAYIGGVWVERVNQAEPRIGFGLNEC